MAIPINADMQGNLLTLSCTSSTSGPGGGKDGGGGGVLASGFAGYVLLASQNP